MKFLYLFAFIAIFQLTTIAQKGGIQFFEQDWNSAVLTAAKENKIIFVDAYTTWCQPCKKMDQQVFPQKTVGDFYNKNFVNVKINMEKGVGKELREKYDVVSYPTYLFVTADGTLVHQIAGYKSVPQFVKLGKTALNPDKRLSAFVHRYEKGERDPAFLLEYTKVRKAAEDGSHMPIAEAYLMTQEDWGTKKNMKFIFDHMDDVDSKLFDYFNENKTVFEKQFGASKVGRKVESLIYLKIYDEKGNADLVKLERLFQKVYSKEVAEQAIGRFKMNYYLDKRSSKKYAETAVDYYKKFPPKSPSEMSDVAYNFYELDVDDKKLLKKSLKWTKSAIKEDASFFNYETLAAVYYKLGKKRKATKAAKKAIDFAKKSKEDYSETQELLGKIKAM